VVENKFSRNGENSLETPYPERYINNQDQAILLRMKRMSEHNQLLPLDQIKPGMRLAEAIRDRLGNIMLLEGVELTESHLNSLQQRGVATALVEVPEPPLSPEERKRQIQAIEDHLAELFHLSADNPLNQQLKDLILSYRMEHFA
jgi:hypothetical protein